MTSIRYHEAADRELLEAVAYFESQVAGLGARLLREVVRAEGTLARLPESGREIRPGIRKWSVRRFPYSLMYSIEGSVIVVLAVAHQSRRPEYWVSRARRKPARPDA